MLALPLPGELLMTYAGLIIFHGKLNWLLSVVASGSGATLGMTIAYWIGYRLGHPFFEKYGSRIHFGPDRLNRLSSWFSRYGNKILIIAYFIPGVRHLTGYFSGMTRLSFRHYAAYAYSGAFFWVFVFLTLGKLLGPKWEQYHHAINRYLIIFGLISAAVYLLAALYKKKRVQIQARIGSLLDRGIRHFHSIAKVKLIILAASFLFIALFSVMIGLIEDYLAHEFTRFDEVSSYVIVRLFDACWLDAMTWMARFGSYPLLMLPIILTGIWIGFKGKDRLLEYAFFVIVVIGGEGLDEGLRLLFHRMGAGGSQLTFPSAQALMALTIYGFAAYLLVRHHGGHRHRILAVLAVAALCLMIGIGLICLGIDDPSDVAAGYVFGGMWMTLNVALLETFRFMRSNRL
ncbi:VTT domain-containing protein [Cohnella nanjingensis]|uniref:VTT domain-containing protein n=2 Tax=Cohnella nanjingensis TaxID=1387779 RepID=A0A7X0VD13_9BACL|nr:VTT domain-containing protein [Cohnella nanjingensis]